MEGIKKENKEIRRKILEYLYQKHEISPAKWIDPKNELIELLELEENRIDSNMHYLEEKGFVKLSKADSSTYMAKISANGIDLVENPDQFNKMFSIHIKQNVSDKSIGIIGNGNITNTNISENTKQYKSSSGNFILIEKTSKIIINKFGEGKTKTGGIIFLLAGLINIVTGIKSLIPELTLFSYWPIILENYASYLLYIGFGLFVIGAFLIRIVSYRHETKCPKCNSLYSFKPSEDDIIKEVEAHDGFHQAITKHLQCENCGHSETVEALNFIPKE